MIPIGLLYLLRPFYSAVLYRDRVLADAARDIQKHALKPMTFEEAMSVAKMREHEGQYKALDPCEPFRSIHKDYKRDPKATKDSFVNMVAFLIVAIIVLFCALDLAITLIVSRHH
jgi:hypothetical protein